MHSLALLALLIGSSVITAQDDVSANLLVSKTILNKYVVQHKDITVEYNIYNVGDGPAHNVLLRDATFPPSDFKVIAGMPEAKWDVIAAGANVTHALVVEPHRPGYFNFSSADITYKTIENTDEVQIGYSSAPGEGAIYGLEDYERVFSPHIADWAVIALMTVPTLAFPYFLWLKSHKQYSGKSKRS
ncbi:SSR2 [Bugula neritina]|uniref:Translocon-associated protein subunit beta n=1 Tax=Bugula neritina TaxID=10212 RepID=A0A7J7KBZ8_BUGNE|nr:SSR2 [Bugula neritina]KAF6030194.1 SSR2 [Bugula neritina]KAF6035817.1 SSR2 [Bugula neritina]